MKLYIPSVNKIILENFTKKYPKMKLDILKYFMSYSKDLTKWMEESLTNDDIVLNRPACVDSLILDSGINGTDQDVINELREEYNFSEYLHYLESNQNNFDFYFNYNISQDNDSENLDKLAIIKDRLYEINNKENIPVPVIQNIDDIQKYCVENMFARVALSPEIIENISPKEFKKSMQKFYDAKIRVHIFRSCQYDILHDIPVWSSDCHLFSGLTVAHRVCYFDEEERKEYIFATHEKYCGQNIHYLFDNNNKYAKKYRAWINQYDIDLDDLKHDIQYVALSNLLYYRWLAEIITTEQKKQGFTFNW